MFGFCALAPASSKIFQPLSLYFENFYIPPAVRAFLSQSAVSIVFCGFVMFGLLVTRRDFLFVFCTATVKPLNLVNRLSEQHTADRVDRACRNVQDTVPPVVLPWLAFPPVADRHTAGQL